jgi:hypothetical protein
VAGLIGLAAADGTCADARAQATGVAAGWYESVSSQRITACAGAPDAPIDRQVEDAMLLARRMRLALVAGDSAGYDAARRDFTCVWADLRRSLGGLDPAPVAALDRALTLVTLSGDPAATRELQRAAQTVLGSAARSEQH